MKKILTILPILFFCYIAGAQPASLAVGCKPGAGGKLTVQVKFLFPDKIVSEYKVNVFRKAAAGTWEKITTTPLARAPLNESITDEDYRNYVGFMKRKPGATPEDESNALAFAGIMILDNNNLARYAGCYYEDATAAAGATYQYRITDAAAGDKELAVSGSFTVTENYLPLITNITFKQKAQNAYLNWDKGTAFFSYNVYRKSSPESKAVKINTDGILVDADIQKDDSRYIDSSLTQGSTFYYEITGVDVLGNESRPSAVIKADIRDMIPPDMVQNLKSKKENGGAVLTWKASKSKDVKGYNIYRNTSADTAYKKITASLLPASAESFADKNMNEGDVYGYKVESVDEAGNTVRTRPVKEFFPDKTPPAKPTGLKAVTKPGIVLITWNKNKEADLKGYYIYRASNRDKDYFNMLYKEPVTANFFNDTLPGVAKNEFIYYIRAVDKNFNTGIPSDTVIATLPDTMAPHAPTFRNITYSEGVVKIEYYAAGEDVVKVDLYRSDDSLNSASYKKIFSLGHKDNGYSDRITTKGQAYHYYIIAYDNAGNASPKSQKRSIYADADSVAISAAANVRASFSARDTAVTISWSSVSKDAGSCIVYRKETEEQRFRSVSALTTQNSFTDKTVEAGKAYKYMIRTVDSNSGEYADSDETAVNTN